jgi:hypothetical protein
MRPTASISCLATLATVLVVGLLPLATHAQEADSIPSPSPSPAATPAASAEPLFAGLGQVVVQLTPESGGGSRPLLDWEPVAGAEQYAVFVYTPSGEAYWAWWGPEDEVHVGGEPQLTEGAPGPAVTEGMSWAVLALDEAGLPLAVSPERSLAP